MRKQDRVSRVLVTDKLSSCVVAHGGVDAIGPTPALEVCQQPG